MTMHNLFFYQQLMQGLRAAIETAQMELFIDDFLAKLALGPE
jgi:queuine/archaeosine tRNA-ribosyltransferase